MLRRFGPLYYAGGLPWFFRRLRMEDHSVERVQRAAARGPVVYVLHTRSMVDWLALNRVLLDRDLPLPRWTNGVDGTAWLPPGEMFTALRERLGGPTPVDALDSGALARAVAANTPVCLFLAPQRDIRDLVTRRDEPDPLPALLQAQALTHQPVQVLPVVVLWDRAPEGSRTEVGRFLLGTADNPGWLGKLFTLATSTGDALVQVGEPIALAEHAERYAGEPEARRLRAIRLALRRYLYREARVVRGPRSRPFAQTRRQVLESKEIQALIERERVTTSQPPEVLRRRVAQTYDKLAARFSFNMVRFMGAFTRFIWNRIYSGIDIRPEDLERIREALRRGTPVLVPAHRSHLDYLLISSLLFDSDVVIPHIVAGDNLSFWPLGVIFRGCGAFFIKRSFSGDRIFPAVFERYLRELIHMEVPVEFFIEGGRSRTGKLLPPKVGVLGMVMDAASDTRPDREVSFLPIYIGYEQIAEERVYARELTGARKQKENVGQIVKAGGVLFQRYGKVYLRVGEPLTAREAMGDGDWSQHGRSLRQERLMAAAERMMFRINQEALALPSALVALAILAHDRRGLRHTDLRDRVERLRAFLAAAGVREGGGLDHVEAILDEAVSRFVAGKKLLEMEESGAKVYSIVPDARTTLEYYKNSVLHAFAPAAYYAAAVRAGRSLTIQTAEVSRLFTVQQFLLRFEFVLDPDADEPEHERRAIEQLIAYGALRRDEGVVTVADPRRISEIANLIGNFHESYLLVLRALDSRGPTDTKNVSRASLEHGKALLAVGEIVRSEALSLQNLDNAVRAFKEDGVIRTLSDGRAELVREAAASYRADLGALLLLDEPAAP